jgi:DNA-binding MarR family transcriptional regulator
VPFEAALAGFRELPTHQRIAEIAFQLNQLGMNPNRIAVHLGVDRTTVTRALRWILTLDE